MKTMRYIALLIVLASCATPNKSVKEAKARQRMSSLDQESQDNINRLIDMIEEQALISDTGEQRYIPYEFRIPSDPRMRKQVHRIDSSVHFTNRNDSYQCIGENATREKVLQIVALPFTYKIRFCPYE